MLWLGWMIGTAGRARAEGRGRPFTFLEAAAFQWINPKAWVMALSIAALAGADDPLRGAAVGAGVFVAAGLTSAHGWALFGAAMRRWLSTDARLRAFNAVMGLSVAASALYLAWTGA
jgi:threonine/homoserine/homoserine lactone efflux protein